MDRRTFREEAIKFLYTLEVGGYYDDAALDNEIKETVSDLIEHTDEVEKILNDSMTGWNLSRLNLVDKAIMKYAVYEMKFKKLPYEIAINEALELTKKYSNLDDNKQVSFNNSVLNKAKSLCQ